MAAAALSGSPQLGGPAASGEGGDKQPELPIARKPSGSPEAAGGVVSIPLNSPAAGAAAEWRPPAAAPLQPDGANVVVPEELLPDEDDGAFVTAGYAICCVVAAEGVFMLLNAFQFGGGLGSEHPMSSFLTTTMKAIGFGDVLFAAAGVFGLWLCVNVLVPLSFESIRKRLAAVSTACVASLLVWRGLVTLCAAPWCGMLLAYHTPGHSVVPSFCLALLYLALNVAILFGLLFVLRAVSARSRALQLQLGLHTAADRKAREITGRDDGDDSVVATVTQALLPLLSDPAAEEGTAFGCLPLAPVLACYLFGLGIAAVVWCIELCVMRDRGVGGWAFVTAVPGGGWGRWVEFLFYLCTFVMVIVAALCVVSSGKAREAARHLQRQLVEEGGEAATEHAEAVEQVLHAQSTSAKILSVCAGLNLLRIMLFVPMTGVALFSKNLCKVHSHLSFTTSIDKAQFAGSAPIVCEQGEVLAIFLVLLVAGLDVYMEYGLAQFCQSHYKRSIDEKRLAMLKAPGGSYGAVQGRGYVAAGTLASSEPAKDSWLQQALVKVEKAADAKASEVLKPVQAPRQDFRSLQAAPGPRGPGAGEPFRPLASAPPA